MAAAVLAVVLPLAGCGGEDAYEGTGTAACPALPGDVVGEVAGDLSSSGKGYDPDADRPESGTLPPTADAPADGIFYSCRWGTTGGGAGLTVVLQDKGADGVAEDTAYLREQSGPELVGSAGGYGRAFYAGGGTDQPQARWACDTRVLQVDLDSPAEGSDALAGVKRLAEALVPSMGCPAG